MKKMLALVCALGMTVAFAQNAAPAPEATPAVNGEVKKEEVKKVKKVKKAKKAKKAKKEEAKAEEAAPAAAPEKK